MCAKNDRFASCKSDTGAAFQAQAYNYIKALDPYHIVIGASDCADNYVFSDVPSAPVKPTAALSDAVIGFGKQPHTQLSLDYIMIENYGGGRRYTSTLPPTA